MENSKIFPNFEKLWSFIFLLLVFTVNPWSVQACTTAVISGKCTPDGRPILFKHRDADSLENKLMIFSDGKYECIGLVNSQNPGQTEIWIGFNSTGFAIMNAASYNLNLGDTSSVKDLEGVLMKKALQTCQNIDEFENLLNSLPHPSGIEANFGVIDAFGGAAYFETGNYDYTKFDVNDSRIAPFGYLVRTNYSFSLNADEGAGYIRYETAHTLFYNASAMNNLTISFLFEDVSRCLKNSLTDVDLWDQIPSSGDKPVFVTLKDFIIRDYSSAAVAIQGVKTGENPQFTTCWCALGLPITSVAMPVWIATGPDLPGILTAPGTENALMSDYALKLRDRCFPIKRGSGLNYLNLAAVINRENSGILQHILPLERRIRDAAREKLNRWRSQGLNKKEVKDFYQWMDSIVISSYRENFGL